MAKKRRKSSSPRKKPVSKFSNLSKTKRPKKIPSLWSLEDGITQSALTTFEQCPEQFSLKYIDGWTSKRISIPLEFGSVMHLAIEKQFKYSSPEETIEIVTEAYRQNRIATLYNPAERDTLEYLLWLAKITFPAYCKYWEQDDISTTWIIREGQFSVPYQVETPSGIREVLLRGMRDGLYRSPISGTLGVFETKNKSRISESEIRDGLRADMQTLFYGFSSFLETGEHPGEVLYNIIRRSDIYRRKSESIPILMKRIKKDMEKKPAHYFMRFKVDVLQSDFKQFKELTLDPLLRRFIIWWDSIKKNPSPLQRKKSLHHYRSLQHLIGKYGKADMWPILVENNTRGFRRRLEVHPELEESFQDSL